MNVERILKGVCSQIEGRKYDLLLIDKKDLLVEAISTQIYLGTSGST